MSEVVTSIDIDAPVADVWAVVMDPSRLHEWVTIHRELLNAEDGQMEQLLCLRGAKFKVQWQRVINDPPHHAEWHGKGPARSHAVTEYKLRDNGRGGTHFDYRMVFHPPLGPFGALAGRALVGGLPAKEAHDSLLRLQALLAR